MNLSALLPSSTIKYYMIRGVYCHLEHNFSYFLVFIVIGEGRRKTIDLPLVSGKRN